MKRLIALFLLLTPLISLAVEARPQIYPIAPQPPEKKIYISPTQIGFSNDQIYVNFEGAWQSVDAIYADRGGIYIKPACFDYHWKCKTCGVINEFFHNTCKTDDCEGKRPHKFTIPKPPHPFLPPLPHTTKPRQDTQ